MVTIGAGMDVVLDVSSPALNGVNLDGKLSFSDAADLELTTEWIQLHGELQIGTEARPHTRNATITFTDNVVGEDIMAGMGDRGIMIVGGTLNLHGDRENAWTKLSATAESGSSSIEVLDASEWRVGRRSPFPAAPRPRCRSGSTHPRLDGAWRAGVAVARVCAGHPARVGRRAASGRGGRAPREARRPDRSGADPETARRGRKRARKGADPPVA
jgi:hypothetical protein